MPSENKTINIGLNQWQGNENLRRQDIVDDNAAIDAAIGNRTIDDTKIPNANDNTSLSTLLSWLGNMIKSITGKTSWRTAPVKSIEQLNNDVVTHTADTAAHGATSAATASKIIARDANGRAKVASPSVADDIARKDTVDAVQTNLTAHTSTAAPHSGHIAHSLATAVNDFLVASGTGIFVKKTLAEVKAILGLGDAAYKNTGTTSGTVASGDHNHSGVYATAAQGVAADNAIPKSTVTTANDFIIATGNAVVARKSLADTRNLLASELLGITSSRTLALSDASLTLNCNNTSAIIITIPPNSSVAFPVGTEIAVFRNGSGDVSITPSSGVTLSSDNGKRKIKNQYMSAVLKKISTDIWILVGALSA